MERATLIRLTLVALLGIASCSRESATPDNRAKPLESLPRIYLTSPESLKALLEAEDTSVLASIEVALPPRFFSSAQTDEDTWRLQEEFEELLLSHGFNEAVWLTPEICGTRCIVRAVRDAVKLCEATTTHAADALEWELSRAGIRAIWNYRGMSWIPIIGKPDLARARQILSQPELSEFGEAFLIPPD